MKAGAPAILWQADYDRGNRVKPRKLSWGTGSSPTFFGSKTGYDYLTTLDAGTNGAHLNIYHTKTGKLLSSALAFDGDMAQGSENSPIDFVYPEASRATEEKAELKKSMQRIDLLDDESGTRVVWFNKSVRSSSVPKAGRDTRRIHFMNYADNDQLYYAELDFETGALLCQSKIELDAAAALPNADALTAAQKEKAVARIGSPFNTMQMAGLYDGKGNLYQGTILGLLKISPAKK